MSDAPLQPLPVDLEELCIALEAEAGDLRWYLDLASGDVILVTHEYEAAEHAGLTVDEIEGTPSRFRRIPPGDPAHAVDDMKAFAAQLSDTQLKESLELALSAPRPDRRFRAVLGWLPDQQQHWHDFRHARCARRARAWLAAQGIAPADRAA
ncbi:MAG: hypothetical protein AMXMBFR34_41660 [Myxococcaceae bacterium]